MGCLVFEGLESVLCHGIGGESMQGTELTYCPRFEDPCSDGDEVEPCHEWGGRRRWSRLTLLQPCRSSCLGVQGDSLRKGGQAFWVEVVYD